MSFSPAKSTNRPATRKTVTYSATDGGAFVTEVVPSKKNGAAIVRRSKRNGANPGRLSDISTSSKTLLSPSPGKTHRPVARSGGTPSSAAAKKRATRSNDDDIDCICSLFSAKVKVTDAALEAEAVGAERISPPKPKTGRYVELIETKKAGLSPVKRSARNA
mmetsp:Transcript_38039/g.83397  ORF Transcript_38039/g.83397 Transcript_38039/m.83397 type:complete len:162 (-) Transcript_38039:419-904(-)|eukprot:CAMPEP_0178511644 /NCGR_PEP_ID=MMETSP0696-20121128/22475_1 /TAXON_ID=265572 /ORGANISM="Extubocellulus spinifer, Strain CCMP396" /LENGTH=161 /DNA_ID=CAMNT_0020141437 /DNA_START=295 /DNA_END=780 /DNA_ORIENTATION=-